ncbi:hypothetical protein R1sor_003659 [Riccia sorocarpa]|uniref:Uncharacterized protein n=1 Tax=Riccia sorocarpa TaxID=122646 RepID=A0ABD3H281_9MARC
MNFGKDSGRASWFPGMHDSWKTADDFHMELVARRRGPSWLGKTPEDFVEMAKARLLARQASWIGHKDKTVADYAAEAKAKLLQDKWIKYKRRMTETRECNQLGRGVHPKTAAELANEAADEHLQSGWVDWKRRVTIKDEYNQLGRARSKTPDQLVQEARELKIQMGWIKWKKRLSEKREYNQLGRARSKTQEELERERTALQQEKGWLEPYRGNSLKKGWVRRYRGSLWKFSLEKSAAALEKVDELQEAKSLRKLELEWVKNIRKVQMPRGLGTEVKAKTEEDIAKDKTDRELEEIWEDELLEDGWKRTYQKTPTPTPRLVWEPRIKTQDELELERIHNELENGWKDDVRMPEQQPPIQDWVQTKGKTKEELRRDRINKKMESRWYKKYKTYNELNTDFPTVQDLVIHELEKIWALEDMELEVREARRTALLEYKTSYPDQLEGPEIEELGMYYNDKLEIDFEDSDDEE